ncbi:S-layer homology domain-containing protein [Bacillus paranthracis]|nr:S-layer homology domain-containing protein [Bacillus paranthracis]
MNFKNVLATGLITATLFGAATTTHAQTALFDDIPNGHWSEKSVNYLAGKGFVSGYGNRKYGFGDNVTRGQVASIMDRYFKLNINGAPTQFTDIKGHMFEDSIKAVVQSGMMIGDGTDKFRPDDTLTRYEMATILQQAFNLTVKGNSPFIDIPNNHWATKAIEALYTNGVTSGVEYNQYGGQYNVTREQFATFMYNAILKGQNPEEKQSDTEKIKRIAEENGFYPNEYGYTFNPYGPKGDSMFDVMNFYIQSKNDREWEAKMFVYSGNPVIDKPIKQILDILLPTKSDELWKIVNSKGLKKHEFEMDGRTIVVEKYPQYLKILIGYKK